MSKDIGILSYGAYIPQRRLQRSSIYAANAWFAPELKGSSKGERAIGNWDEDAITMGVEAARDALTGWDRATLGGLSLASTTLPFADRLNAGVIKEALNLEDSVSALDSTGSLRAGSSALIQALKAASAGGAPQLCIAADLRKAAPASDAELAFGDAAAAMLVGSGKPIAKFLGAHSVTVDFVDHFRATGVDFDYSWEGRWIRDEGYMNIAAKGLKKALETFGVAGQDIGRCAIAISSRGVPEALAKKVGLNAQALIDPLSAQVGDAGAAHPLLMLASAFEQAEPGEKILLVSFGQGLDVLLLEATAALKDLPPRMGVAKSIARRKPDENYLRYLFHRGALPLERGMRAEKDERQPATTLYRNRKSVLALVGGRCYQDGHRAVSEKRYQRRPDRSRHRHARGLSARREASPHRHLHRGPSDLFTRSAHLLRYARFRGRRTPHDGVRGRGCGQCRGGSCHAHGLPYQGGGRETSFQTLFLESRAGRVKEKSDATRNQR